MDEHTKVIDLAQLGLITGGRAIGLPGRPDSNTPRTKLDKAKTRGPFSLPAPSPTFPTKPKGFEL